MGIRTLNFWKQLCRSKKGLGRLFSTAKRSQGAIDKPRLAGIGHQFHISREHSYVPPTIATRVFTDSYYHSPIGRGRVAIPKTPIVREIAKEQNLLPEMGLNHRPND